MEKWELLVHLISLLQFNLKLLERGLYSQFQFIITHLYLTPCNLTCSVARTGLQRIWLAQPMGFSSDFIPFITLAVFDPDSHCFPFFDSWISHSIASHLFSPLSYGTSLFSNVLSICGLPFEHQACTLNCLLNI